MKGFPGEFFYFDFFSTKGMEYLMVIGFLFGLIGFWRWANKHPYEKALQSYEFSYVSWFLLPDGLHYHRGHTWVSPEGDIVKVGIDDFAQKLLGRCQEIIVPSIGERLEQGASGLRLRVDSTYLNVLSPVKGEVVDINENVIKNPELINKDPYGQGWIIKVRPDSVKTTLRNLLSGRIAKIWLEENIDAIREKMVGNLGMVYQDGGVLVTGLAKAIDPENWQNIVKEFLLTD